MSLPPTLPSLKSYVFPYDFLNPACRVEALFEYIRASAEIANWASYVNGTFLIRSYMPASVLSEGLRKVVGPVFMHIFEATPQAAAGWLPGPAWEWINQGHAPPAASPSAPRITPEEWRRVISEVLSKTKKP